MRNIFAYWITLTMLLDATLALASQVVEKPAREPGAEDGNSPDSHARAPEKESPTPSARARDS